MQTKQLCKFARIMPAEKINTCVRGRTGNPGRERQFTRRAVLVVHHSCTESKATTRNLVAAPEEPSNAKALPETGTAIEANWYENVILRGTVCVLILVTQQLHPTPLVSILPPDPLLVEWLILQGSQVSTHSSATRSQVSTSV